MTWQQAYDEADRTARGSLLGFRPQVFRQQDGTWNWLLG